MKLFIIFIIIIDVILSTEIPKIIWLFWQSGFETAPLYIKLNLKNIKHYAELGGWIVQPLDKYNLKDYFDVVPPRKFLLPKKQSQHYSDLIRLQILYKYGGVYMDATCILVETLQWIANAKNNRQFLNKYGQQPNIILFYHYYHADSYHFMELKDRLVYPNLGYQSWFIASIAQAELLFEWKKQFLLYIEKGRSYVQSLFFQPQYNFGKMLDEMPSFRLYLIVYIAIYTVIQRKQIQLNAHGQFAVNYYGLWALNGLTGPSMIHDGGNIQNGVNILTRWTMSQIMQQFNGFSRYFIKLIGPEHAEIQKILQKSDDNSIVYRNPLLSLNLFKYRQFLCQNYVIKGSVIDKYILAFADGYQLIQNRSVVKCVVNNINAKKFIQFYQDPRNKDKQIQFVH